MDLISVLEEKGLREFQDRPFHPSLYTFERFKQTINHDFKVAPCIRIPVTICTEIDTEAHPCTLTLSPGQVEVIRRSAGNIKDGLVKVGPFYLEV